MPTIPSLANDIHITSSYAIADTIARLLRRFDICASIHVYDGRADVGVVNIIAARKFVDGLGRKKPFMVALPEGGRSEDHGKPVIWWSALCAEEFAAYVVLSSILGVHHVSLRWDQCASPVEEGFNLNRISAACVRPEHVDYRKTLMRAESTAALAQSYDVEKWNGKRWTDGSKLTDRNIDCVDFVISDYLRSGRKELRRLRGELCFVIDGAAMNNVNDCFIERRIEYLAEIGTVILSKGFVQLADARL